MDLDYSAPLPAVAAEYHLERTVGGEPPVSANWRLWREPDQVQRDFPSSGTTEVWRRDGGALFHVKYFHEARRGIEFQQADLSMLEALPAWQQVALTVSPKLIEELQPAGAGTEQGHEWRRYSGEHRGVHWDITIRTDLMVPTSVERSAGSEKETIKLVGAWRPADAPWMPATVSDYDVMDFADMGDHERDPFVLAVQGQLGMDHGHSH